MDEQIEFKEFDYDALSDVEKRVYDMIYTGTSVERIAMTFNVTRNTMYNKFRQVIGTAQLNREMDLRRAQRSAALGGNATMLVWLGKNELGQTDSGIGQDSGEDVSEITFTVKRVPKPTFKEEGEE